MKYYYLIEGKIMSANEKMPILELYKETFKHLCMPYVLTYLEVDYRNWLNSLQPCEISESELMKIYTHLSIVVTDVCLRDYIKNPIEVTDIVADFGCDHDGVWRECLKFKQPKQVEEIEAVDFAEWILDNTAGILGTKQRNYYVKGLLHGKYTTKQLYEIFKNQK